MQRVKDSVKPSLVKSYETFKSFYYKRKDINSLMIFNLIILWSLGVSILLHMGNAKYFTFPMTKNVPLVDIQDITETVAKWGITENFPIANPLGEDGRKALAKEVFPKAHCYVVSYSSDQRWGLSDTSPQCNCLMNMLTEFAMSHVANNQTRISELETMTQTQLKTLRTEEIQNEYIKVIKEECFNGVRATQVEELHEPGSLYSVNIITCALMWNFVSSAACYYIMRHASNEKMMKDDGRTSMQPNILIEWLFFALGFVLMLWPVFLVLGFGLPATSWILPLVISLLFTSYVAFLQYSNFRPGESSWQFPKSAVFWVSYSINIAYLVGSFNALTQRREDTYNAATTLLVICIGFLCICVEYARVGFNYISNYAEIYKEFWSQTWLVIVAVAVMILSTPDPKFSVGPFSNAKSVVGIAFVIMLLIPVIQKKSAKFTTSSHENDIAMYRMGIDFAARVIFTVAVVSDLVATGRADNYHIRVE